MAEFDFFSLVNQFSQSLHDCRDLYRSSARTVVEQHPQLIRGGGDKFLTKMDDLHKGLLLKIYFEVALADRRWVENERTLAQILFEHTWRRTLQGAELREAAEQLAAQSVGLDWYGLVRPFDQIAPLRNRVGELQSIVLRVANIVARADGSVGEREQLAIRHIQDEVDRHLQQVPLDEPSQHAEANRALEPAIDSVERMATDIHQSYHLPDPSDSQIQPAASKNREVLLQEALSELEPLIGLTDVKQEVRTLANFIRLQQQRTEAGLPNLHIGLHMAFVGNPGTGKTTVARIVGRILGTLGVLKTGHLVETDRSGLVGQYAGQTAQRTNRKIDEALDGVLFIDEAYSLRADDGPDSYGGEAIQALLKRMEDDRGRLVVIFAGYSEPMQRMLRSNPGLSSRVNRTFTFDDYTPSELGQIFELFCQRNHYELPAAARAKLLVGFHWLYQHRDEHFGNGRLVRNVFESSLRHMANRLAVQPSISAVDLTRLALEDLHLPDVPPEVWPHLTDDKLRFAVTCPGCQQTSRVPSNILGQRVRCKKCKHAFVASWGEVG
jgi:hypothetical protein